MNKGTDGTARVCRLVFIFNKVGVLTALKFYKRLVNKANFDNLKIYTVFKYIATWWCHKHNFRRAFSSIRSFLAYISSLRPLLIW